MTQTVTVGCKLPWGLICEMGKPGESNHKRVEIHGTNAHAHADKTNPMIHSRTRMPHVMVGGFALTPGVPKDFIDAWMKHHAQLDAVRNGLIFVEGAKAAQEFAQEMGPHVKAPFAPLAQVAPPAGGKVVPGVITAKADE